MSLQGPIIVVAERPAADLTQALSAAGAFPIVETNWTDAPTAFVAVKPSAVVIAEPGAPRSETSARMLCLQFATASGPIVPTIALAQGPLEVAVPVALPADASLPVERLIARLQSAMRVRALHAAVLRRIETFASHGGKLPALPVGDALDDATMLIAGRGPLYPALSVAIGERVSMLGGLSMETAARHLATRDIDGIVVGDGFSPRMVEAFLTLLAQDTRFRDIPVAVIGDAPPDFFETLPNIDHVDGMFDPQTGLLTRDRFFRDLSKTVAEANDRSQALSIARFSFDGPHHERCALDRARLVTRLIRNIDFATGEDDGAILVAFTQTDLRSAHVVARRIAASLKSAVAVHEKVTANVALATLKSADTLDSLMIRVVGNRVVAAKGAGA